MAFNEIRGQNSPVSILRSALRKNRLAHAYIFTGPDGVGKRRTALMLAKAMNCQSSPEPGDCCDRCSSCRKIDSGNHADVISIEPEGESIKIDQIRELQRRLRFRPMEGGRRACLVDGAERMNEAASNALLKTLEEPPEETHLFLVTCRPHQLLPTIQSRCQWVKFKPLPTGQIEEIVRRELPGDAEKASFFASLAGGSAGKALALCDRGSFQERLKWLGFFKGASAMTPAEIWETCEKMSKDEDLEDFLDLWKIWVRDLLVYRIQGRGLINHDLADEIAAEAEKVSLERLDHLFGLLSQVQRAISLNANRQLTLETLFLGMQEPS
jgi:DNA polymerase III subunit delta'